MAGSAYPVYQSAGVLKRFADLGGTNADTILIDKIDTNRAAGGLSVALYPTLGSNAGSADTLVIGDVTNKNFTLNIAGSLDVDGDEIVNGDTTFEGSTQIGTDSADDLTIDAKVTSNILFDTATTDRSITSNGTNDLIVETATSGNLILQSAADSTLTSATGTTIGATLGGVSITPTAGGVSINPTAGNVTIGTTGVGSTLGLSSVAGTTIGATAGGVTVNPTAGGVSLVPTAGGVSINPVAGNVSIQTTALSATIDIAPSSGNDINLTTAGDGKLDIVSGTAGISAVVTAGPIDFTTSTSGNITFTPAGNLQLVKNSETVAIVAGSIDPTTGGGVAAPTGSIYLRNAASGDATGEVWVKQDNATATSWTQLASATGSVSLQSAYNTGNTIETTASRSLIFESLYNAGVTSEFVVRHEGGGDNFLTTTTTSATAGTLDLGSTNVTIKPLNNVAFDATGNPSRSIGLGGSGTLTISQTGTGAMTVATTATGALTLTSAVGATWGTTTGTLALATGGGNGNISLTTNGTGKVQMVATGGSVEINSSSASVMSLLTGTASPNGSVTTGNPGSLYLQGTVTPTGDLWVKQSAAGGSVWTQLAGMDDVTLQGAYNNGPTITTASTTDIEFTLSSGGFTVSSTASGTFLVDVADGGTGDFAVRDVANGYRYLDATAGVMALGDTTDVTVNVPGHIINNLTFDATGNASHAINLAGSGTLTISQTGTGALTVATTATGALTLTSAAAATWSTTAGILTLDGAGGLYVTSGNATTIAIGEETGGNSTLSLNSNWSTGTINMDCGGQFTIGNDACGAFMVQTTAAGAIELASGGNLSLTCAGTYDVILTAGNDASSDILFVAHNSNQTPFNSTSDVNLSTDFPVASRNIVGALNYLLTEAGGATAAVTSGEAYSVGDALYISTANGKAYKCDANVEASSVFVGFAKDEATAADEPHTVYVSGEVTVSTNISGLANGTVVFLSGTAGAITGTAPSTAGDTVLKVGIITNKGTGAGDGKIAIQVGTAVVL